MKTALITGGARGIGRAIAADLAGDHHVAITHKTTDPGPFLTERPDVFAIEADLGDPQAAVAAVTQTVDHFGRLDILINNAGTVSPNPVGQANPEALRETFDVNVVAPMILLSAALPHLAPGACVINISSTNAVLPAMGASAYSASKAALNTWTRGMAKELGPKGIRVNAVAPGATERVETPRPDDIAAAVRFLLSDAASFITGEVLNFNGGYRL